ATFSTEFTTAYQEVLSTIGTAGIAHASFSASVNVASGALAGTLNIGQPSLALTSATIASSPATTIGPTSTGAFGALVGKDVTLPSLPFAAGPVSDVFTVAGLPDVRFTLTNVDSGVLGAADCTSPPAAGEGCTPSGSSLNLLDTGEGFDLSLSAEGTAFDSATLDTTPFDAIFSAELDGMSSYQALLAAIGSGGTVDLPYSVELAAGPFGATSPVPEPTTPALLGAGILASLAFGRLRQPRRRVTRSAEPRA
ncbi:MAG: PEP-CTERM sorting domain-containing protein, partial [Steroidobacteraceae bacterium]